MGSHEEKTAGLSAWAGRNYYTSETTGHILLRTPFKGRWEELSVDVSCRGRTLVADHPLSDDVRSIVAFPLDGVPDGTHEIKCRLLRRSGGETAVLDEAKATLAKLPPKANEVKIDYLTRGLVVDGQPFLACGFYALPPRRETVDHEARYGFTHVGVYSHHWKGGLLSRMHNIRAYMDRCACIGMKFSYHTCATAHVPASEEDWDTLRREIEAFRDHPSLLAWYIADEPECTGKEPSALARVHRFIKELDPYHPVSMVFQISQRAGPYLNAMDILMIDPYPIPNDPITRVAGEVDAMNQVTDRRMPVWVVPQAFGSSEWFSREPTSREARVMTYLALIHGATGIQYFINVPGFTPVDPMLWCACRRLSLEVAELGPALLSSETPPTVSTSVSTVHAAGWRNRGVITLLAANTVNESVSMHLQVSDVLDSGHAAVPFENRSVPVINGMIEDAIEPFGTRVYTLPVASMPEEDLLVDAGNLIVNPSFEQMTNVGSADGFRFAADFADCENLSFLDYDPGASVVVDSRMARHGRHSLRMTTPAKGKGRAVSPMFKYQPKCDPAKLVEGANYRFSVWARGKTRGLELTAVIEDTDTGVQEFVLDTEWREYVFETKARKTVAMVMIKLELISAGTAWIDLLQVVRVNGC